MPPAHDAVTQLQYYESLESMEGLVGTVRPPLPRLLAVLPQGRLIYTVYPGVIVAGTIALAASWLSQHYATPVMLFALLLGMAFHFLHEEGRCIAGIEFCSRTVLRFGIALLGLRITLAQIASLGFWPVVTILVGVSTTILLGAWLGGRLKLGRAFGVLSGGAVAVCGASAALAISTALPRYKNLERDTILTVVTVTALSTVVMILYPMLVAMLGIDHRHAGVFLGGAIHDVAQVVGAGYMISPETGDIATYVKLLRVATLMPIVFAIGFLMASKEGQVRTAKAPLLPTFLIAFAVLVVVNSLLPIPPIVTQVATDVSSWCLMTAIAALGMKTSFRDLIKVGWRPVGLILAETVWIGALVLASVYFLL
jgi:uncharacterized integral membrane protein (TIGR00698 family)